MDFAGKRVLLQADLNEPVQDGKSERCDAHRARDASHPPDHQGGQQGDLVSAILAAPRKVDKAFSLEIVVPAVADGTSAASSMPTGWMCRRPGEAIDAPDGSVLVLENTRFHPGEEENDPELAERMASLGDIFINDAFSAAHRAHASMTSPASCRRPQVSRCRPNFEALKQG